MAFSGNAPGRWLQMVASRHGFIRRCELYASYTLPKLCLPDGYDQNTSEISHDYQAVGAQFTNHLANKIMLAGFAPSRPFFVLDPTSVAQAEMDKVGVDKPEVVKFLAKAEKDAVKTLDRMAMRPKLYEVIKNLIVLGNVMLVLNKDETSRVIGIKKYTVRRSASGQILEIMLIDKVMFDELDPKVQDAVRRHSRYPDDREVTLYKWIKRDANGDFLMEQWVDTYQLPKEFNGKWPEATMPYRVLTWDLSDDAHYGTGLVEDYKGDFAGLSILSKAQVIGAVLASEFRWLVNPAGLTRPEDLENSENGSALPGAKDDIHLVESGKSADLRITLDMNETYVNRIGRGFLAGSSVVRNAERVTAEEIRMQADELETSLGGAYSRLAVDLQLPLARWLLVIVKVGGEAAFIPTVVTGLEALSRTGDLENLKLWLSDMGAVATLPPSLQGVIKMKAIATALAAPRRINVDEYLKSDDEIAQDQANALKQQQEMMASQAGANVAEKTITQQGEQPA